MILTPENKPRISNEPLPELPKTGEELKLPGELEKTGNNPLLEKIQQLKTIEEIREFIATYTEEALSTHEDQNEAIGMTQEEIKADIGSMIAMYQASGACTPEIAELWLKALNE